MLRTLRSRSELLAYVAGFVLFVASCSGDTDGGDPQKAPDSGATATTRSGADTVRVTLDEYSIGIPRVLPAGRNLLRLESLGFEEHNLLFVLNASDSLVWETERRLSPYETRTVSVDLVPGAYTVVCDFSGHEGRGMFTELTVEARAAN